MINETEGEIISLGWPGYYQDHQNCLYTILIQPENILKLTFTFDIHRSNSCRTEFLKVQHGYFRYNRRLCGYMDNLSYYIKDSNATSTYLRFRTRNLNTISDHRSSGFRVVFKQVLRSSVPVDKINQVVINRDTIEYSDKPWLK